MKQFTITNKDRSFQYQNMMKAMANNATNRAPALEPLKATRMRSIINSHRLADAYKKDSKVAYIGEQFPTELIFAFGLMAWNIESMSILFSQAGDVDEYFNLTQANGLSRDICSFLRGPFGLMLANCYPTPDLVVANDQPCDCLGKLKFMASRFYEVPIFSLNTPNNIDDNTVAYLVAQMERLFEQLEDATGILYDPERFKKVVEDSNLAKEYYYKTAVLLQENHIPGVSRELHEIFGMNYFGLKETARICQVLYEEALEKLAQTPCSLNRKRVLWVGQIPESSHELLAIFEKEVEILYWAPLWEANLMTLDEQAPLHSIARRAILYHWHSERMRQNTEEIVDRFHIDGMVVANMWGCRNMMGISPMLRKLAAQKGIKCLTVNIDIVDKNNYSFNNVKTRIDAFLEMLL